MVSVRLSEDATGASTDVQLPVLDSSMPEYQPYMPPTPATGASVRPSVREPGKGRREAGPSAPGSSPRPLTGENY